MIRRPPRSTRTDTLFPYTTLFRSGRADVQICLDPALHRLCAVPDPRARALRRADRAGVRRCTAAVGRLDDRRADLCELQYRRRGRDPAGDIRSEEHTSELQSLMRISYAVFCLKKKKKKLDDEDVTT